MALQEHSDQFWAVYDQFWAVYDQFWAVYDQFWAVYDQLSTNGAVTTNNSTLVTSSGIIKAEATLPTLARAAVRGRRALRYQRMSWWLLSPAADESLVSCPSHQSGHRRLTDLEYKRHQGRWLEHQCCFAFDIPDLLCCLKVLFKKKRSEGQFFSAYENP